MVFTVRTTSETEMVWRDDGIGAITNEREIGYCDAAIVR